MIEPTFVAGKLYKQTICCCRSWDISHAATNLWPEPAKIKATAVTIPLVSGDKVCKNGDTDKQGGSVAYLLDTTVTESPDVNTLIAYPALLDSASNGDSVYTGRQEASVGCLLDTSVTTETANTPIVCFDEHTDVTEQINYWGMASVMMGEIGDYSWRQTITYVRHEYNISCQNLCSDGATVRISWDRVILAEYIDLSMYSAQSRYTKYLLLYSCIINSFI